MTNEEAVARLEVWGNQCDLCQREVEQTGRASGHDASGHPDPRQTVHSMAGSFGADWDAAEAIAFVRAATEVRETGGFTKATGHGIAAQGPDGRWVAFATKGESQ